MDTKRLTPMLAQYREIKARFPDALVLFRLGDFYETFESDAEIAARELELTLTSRAFAKGVRLPMAGVPHHHVQTYIVRLIERGYKIALVEQLEDPGKVKRLVKRDVIRVITPGTVVEDALLRAHSENYLAAIVREESTHRSTQGPAYGLAVLDVSVGEFATTQIEGPDAESRLLNELQRLQASEYVLTRSLLSDRAFLDRIQAIHPARMSPIEDGYAEPETSGRVLREHFRVATLQPFGCQDLPLAVSAAGAALYYLKRNQPHNENVPPFTHLNQLWTFSLADYMTLDAATRRNLELTAPIQTLSSSGRNPRSLFGVLDHTGTAMGARLLKRWVHQPLLDLDQIHARLDAVDELYRNGFLRATLRSSLDGLYDIERLVGRIGFGNV